MHEDVGRGNVVKRPRGRPRKPTNGSNAAPGFRHPESLAESGELTSKPLNHLEPQEVQAILDSVCQREPETKRRYKEYKAFGGWDLRTW